MLEVLIACGLLVMGLSTMAAILPAAGFRLAQATMEDRAGVLSANALADAMNRDLLSASAFPLATTAAPTPARTLAFGAIVGQLPSYGQLPNGRTTTAYFASPPAETLRRHGSPRTFFLEDELTYRRSTVSGGLTNSFTGTTTGPRESHAGICWGATLAAAESPPTAGGKAILTVAVFKRDGDLRSGDATIGMPIVLTNRNGHYETTMTSSGSLLRPCSWVLAIPPSSDAPARWFQVVSSWTVPSASQTICLLFRNQEDFVAATSTASSGATAMVFAFESLIRADEHVVTLR